MGLGPRDHCICSGRKPKAFSKCKHAFFTVSKHAVGRATDEQGGNGLERTYWMGTGAIKKRRGRVGELPRVE